MSLLLLAHCTVGKSYISLKKSKELQRPSKDEPASFKTVKFILVKRRTQEHHFLPNYKWVSTEDYDVGHFLEHLPG